MYAYIKGTLEETGEDYIVVEAGGIGYQIFTTGQTFQYLPSMGEEVKVYTYLHVREDCDGSYLVFLYLRMICLCSDSCLE
mgnify:CR=1 FL=1